MLVQFTFSNYKCFKDETVLNLTTNNVKGKDLYSFDTPFDYRVLKTSAVYGANASGKSKLFDAFSYLKTILENEKNKGDYIWQKMYDPFRLNTDSMKRNMCFEVVFIIDEVQYRYAIELNRNIIVAEYLYEKEKGKKETYIFERDYQSIKPNRLKKTAKIANVLIKGEMVKEEVPFLTALDNWKDGLAMRIMEWFKSIIFISGNEFLTISPAVFENSDLRKTIVSFLQMFDINIEDLGMHEVSIEDIPQKIKSFMGDDLKNGPIYDGISTKHKLYDGNYNLLEDYLEFQLEKDESFGTYKLLSMCLPIMRSLLNNSVLFIDEFDSGIHPNLLRKIVELFYMNDFKGKSQLIINTQNSSLLNRNISDEKLSSKKLFIKDQIFFVDKNKYGESSLCPLSDFDYPEKLRANIENLYLDGTLDGVPYISDYKEFLKSINSKEVVDE